MDTGITANARRLIEELAGDRDAAERRFRLGLQVARAAGGSVGELASAARLSTSRINAILEPHDRRPRALSPDEIEHLLENDPTVGIVPAGRIALRDYENYHAYICQPYRSFRQGM